MSLSITVQRGSGDNPGEDIILEYFKTEETARQVGRVAIDQATVGLKKVSGTLFGVWPFYRPGAIIRHYDLRQGDCRGKIEDFSGQIAIDTDGTPSASVGLTFRRLVL